jgi:RimJ/RimL family protein N-acetyltransferase
MIPRLATERLILRGFRPEDFEPFAGFMADPDVMRYLHGEPLTRADAFRQLCTAIGHWTLRGYGTWAVERKADGAFIGRIGLINPEGWPGLEVGWTLGKPYWGQGYATEAGAAALRYAFLTQPEDRILSCIVPDNLASQRVAQRLGDTKGPRHDIVISGNAFTVDLWSITRDAWNNRLSKVHPG